jgi:response regulator RpfG family c-di-GMP phosphodiesterase
MSAPQNQLADLLLRDRLITPEQYESVVHRVQGGGTRVEDALVDTGVLSEADLLKYLARLYRTRFVATQKLARVEVDRSLLEMVPRKVAERFQLFPILFEPLSGTLSVVSPDAGDPSVTESVKMATNLARDVRVYIARPAAVKAAINKHYGGDLYAFAHVDPSGKEQYMTLLDLYDRGSGQEPRGGVPTAEKARDRVLSDKDLEANARTVGSGYQLGAHFLDATTVLVSLIENGRGDLRGHSALVTRWLRRLSERIRLSPEESNALALAGLLHDVGKASVYHLTALNVAEYESHRAVAQKSYLMPLRLFESVPLGAVTLGALRSMYERFDGYGFPEGLSGKDIPLGGRLLAVADTYADLTQNARNPFRRNLQPTEACDVLDRYKGTIFDGNLIDLVRHTVTGEGVRARLLADRPVLVLVEPDAEEGTVVELFLIEHGYDVRAVRTADEAHALLERGGVDACLCETDLDGASGLELLAQVRAHPWGKDLPWIFLTHDGTKDSVERAYKLGATDYLNKPLPNPVLEAKLQKSLQLAPGRVSRGVAGSLVEMALTDIVQVLAQGRKSGGLKIRSGTEAGEIHFTDGQVVNAMWGPARGTEAFFAMLHVSEGEFSLDPSFKPGARVIQVPVEALLLEGVRRLDESGG